MSIPGSRVADKYELEELLNDSEVVEVWRATRIATGDTILLKLLGKEFTEQPEAVTRFQQQYETLRELGGRHVVVPIDIGQTPEGRLYLVTEFLEGQTLKERVEARGALPVAEVVDFVTQACLGLQDAHVRKIIHRDIKPSNLFLVTEAEGQHVIKIIDFEMAKRRDIKITREGQALGSAMYMPPEQMRSAAAVGPNADIWALGITMYYLTCGKYPFEGKSVTALAMAIMNDAPIPLASRAPNLPKEFVDIVHRCLSRNPNERYGTGGQLRQALLGLSIPTEPIVAAMPQGPVTTMERPSDPQFDAWLGGVPSNPFRHSNNGAPPGQALPAFHPPGAAYSSVAVQPSASEHPSGAGPSLGADRASGVHLSSARQLIADGASTGDGAGLTSNPRRASAPGRGASVSASPRELANGASAWTFWAFALPIAGALVLAAIFWWFIL